MNRTVEQVPRISVAPIHRAVESVPLGDVTELPIETDGRVTTTANFVLLTGGVTARVCAFGRRHVVLLARESLHFGGARTWLVCPRCNARRRHLYVFNNCLVCRGCTQLRYDGQRRHRATGYEFNTRPRRALAKIRAKLARVRSVERKLDLLARADEMLRLLDAGAERQAAMLRKMQDRAEHLAKTRSSPGGGSPTPIGPLPA